MEFTPLSSLIVALLILLLAAGVFIILQLKKLQAQIDKLTYRLYFEITRRSDLIPQFLERASTGLPQEKLQEILLLRRETMQINTCGKNKRDLEISLWQKFDSLLKEICESAVNKNDLVILSLKKEKLKADKRVAETQTTYNQQVNKYLAVSNNFLIKPISLLIKTKNFEPY